MIAKNKQVNVWRGPDAPPTIHHVWIKDDDSLYLHNGTAWVSFMEYPGLSISVEDGKAKVSSGDDFFYITTSGTAIGINTNVADTITITSDALNTIDTDEPLQWDKQERKLSHLTSGVTEEDSKEAGASSDATNVSSFYVPYIKVDKFGHVVNLQTHLVSVPAIVEQTVITPSALLMDLTDRLEYHIIVSPSPTNTTDKVNKIPGVVVALTKEEGEVVVGMEVPRIKSGNVKVTNDLVVDGYIRGTVVGDVQGEAIPKSHASTESTYGIGTTDKYGHNKLQHTFNTDNEVIVAPTEEEGVAASPVLVYRALASAKAYTDGVIPKVSIINEDSTSVKLPNTYAFSDDFELDNNKLYINWLEV